MVLSRRHWLLLVLSLILMMLLAACERPLTSNESETAEQSVEATAVAETAEEAAESTAVADTAEAESGDGAGAEATADSAEENVQDADAESEGEAANEGESSDSEVGGGTPDMAEDEQVNSDAEADEAAAEEDQSAEDSTEEAPSAEAETEESEDSSGGDDNAEEMDSETAATDDAAEAGSEDSAAEETMTAESDESAGQEEAASSAATLPATHIVQPGENLYRIGLKYGLSWVTLAAYNHLPNANYIRVGQVLQIPGGSTPNPVPPPTTPDEPGYTNYVVQRGDTLNSIGRKYGVSWVEIAEANGIVNPNLIYAGQVLKIPTSQPQAPPSLTHTVKPGETLNRISLQYGVHWLAIAQANNIAPPYVIYPGQVLAIPSG